MADLKLGCMSFIRKTFKVVLILIEAVTIFYSTNSPLFFLGIVKRAKRANARENCFPRGDAKGTTCSVLQSNLY